MIPSGICQCGCGEETKTAIITRTDRGQIKGQPLRYIFKHYGLTHGGGQSPHWKGGRVKRVHGYTVILRPSHPRAHGAGYVYEHILVMESMIGRFLIAPEEVHHWDGDKSNNVPENLHLCKDNFEHSMIHRWMNARAASGRDDWRKCRYCNKWGPPDEMRANQTKYAHTITGVHPACEREYKKQRRLTMESVKACALAFLLFIPPVASAQISCFTYYGGVLSCDSSSSNTTIAPFGDSGQGVITEYGSGRNTLEPYTIITPQPRSTRSSRGYNLDLQPLAPLPALLGLPPMPGMGLPGLPGLELP